MEFVLPGGIKGLIFDLDGTLADSMPYHMKSWQEACRSFGLDMSSEFLRSLTGTPGKKIARALVEKYSKENSIDPFDIAARKKEIFSGVQHLVKEIRPVADIARRYHGKLPMAVGTGGPGESAVRTLEVIGMKDLFDVIVTADDVENYKPHPETFLKCAEKMDLTPGEILVFEDGDLGIKAAEEAGMKVVDVRGWYENTW